MPNAATHSLAFTCGWLLAPSEVRSHQVERRDLAAKPPTECRHQCRNKRAQAITLANDWLPWNI